MKTILFIVGITIILGMSAYCVYLLLALRKQKTAISAARAARAKNLRESIIIIAKAMQNGDCNLSEGVIRLKMLLDPLGQKKLDSYHAMFELYQVVKDMPTHDARTLLKKNERMRLDLQRESSEAELESQIKTEISQLLNDIQHN